MRTRADRNHSVKTLSKQNRAARTEMTARVVSNNSIEVTTPDRRQIKGLGIA
jgi:hypothetical protein